MYSRNYYPDAEESARPPENYNGTVFTEKEAAVPEQQREPQNEAAETMAEAKECKKGGLFSSIPKSIPLPSLLGKFGISSLSMPKIGTEEILIIAVAAYLFFTKEGDKECAIMLILLLFVS